MRAETWKALGENSEPMRREQGQKDTLFWNTLLRMSMRMAPTKGGRGYATFSMITS